MSRPWTRLRARTRLTLWYVALLAGTLVLLGGLGQWFTRQGLYASQDDVLRSKAAAVASEVDLEKGRIEFPDDGPRNALPGVAAGLDVVRVWDRDGATIFEQTPGSDFPDVAPPTLAAALAGAERFETVPAADDTFRLYLQPVIRKGQVVGALEIGRSEAELHTLLGQLRTVSLAGLVVALVVAWLGGSFLAGRALRPVDLITRAAERLSADDLSLRLPAPTVDDEFGRQTAAFNTMLARLERAFERQRRFTADASHELRTPLSVIRSLAEVALTSPRDEAYDRAVYASIAEETERLSRLVESLLTLARADDGAPLMLAAVDLDDLALDAVERVAERAARQGVELDLTTAERCRVWGDASWLTQLVLNLLDNSLRHTPAGGRVSLSVTTDSDGVRLAVADTGVGIAPEHLPRLFERFYRVDAARSRGTGGAGLGLAICDWIARAHAGRLSVASQVGRGTTFTLWLPNPAELASAPTGGHRAQAGGLGWAAQSGQPDRPALDSQAV
jgi:heavy metal sensor kinase